MQATPVTEQQINDSANALVALMERFVENPTPELHKQLQAAQFAHDVLRAQPITSHDLRYSNDQWQIISPNNTVLFQSNSKKLVIHEFRRLTGVRLSDADFAAAFANRDILSR